MSAQLALLVFLHLAPVEVLRGPAPCTQAPLAQVCHNGLCHPDNKECPPVTTELSCGEHPHSGRDGVVLTWGLSHRATSAQDCCDKCKHHAKHCNSWTFCGLPVCWGLDTGHNHTYGECVAALSQPLPSPPQCPNDYLRMHMLVRACVDGLMRACVTAAGAGCGG